MLPEIRQQLERKLQCGSRFSHRSPAVFVGQSGQHQLPISTDTNCVCALLHLTPHPGTEVAGTVGAGSLHAQHVQDSPRGCSWSSSGAGEAGSDLEEVTNSCSLGMAGPSWARGMGGLLSPPPDKETSRKPCWAMGFPPLWAGLC